MDPPTTVGDSLGHSSCEVAAHFHSVVVSCYSPASGYVSSNGSHQDCGSCCFETRPRLSLPLDLEVVSKPWNLEGFDDGL
jgi:hypothetical protein